MVCPRCGFKLYPDSSFCNQCGASLLPKNQTITQSPAEDTDKLPYTSFSKGDWFGKRYKIIKELGRGGMGIVYKATDLELNIKVALKIIHPELLIKNKIVRRFKKEILLAREISHENIIRIHDFGDIKGIKFISMQYIAGSNLKEIIEKKGPLDTDTATRIILQICEGLKAAHKKGIIHKDLKPSNIMMEEKGNVYLTDFGLAESIDAVDLTQSGGTYGTPEYISPEQAMGKKVDPRADIYSFGNILYEIFTGSPPFKSETVMGYLQKHVNEAPIIPSRHNPDIPVYYEKIILKCLKKDRKLRYQEIAEVIKDILQQKATATSPTLSFLNNRTIRTCVIILLIISVLYLVYLSFIKKCEPLIPKKKSIAIMYFENHTGDPGLNHWKIALPDLLTHDMLQSKYFKVLPEDKLYQILKNLSHLDSNRYSTDILEKVSRLGKAEFIVLGSLTRSEDFHFINVKIRQPSLDNLVSTIQVRGKGEGSFHSMIDELTRKIKFKLDLTEIQITEDIDKEISDITSSSKDAIKFYIQGKKLYNSGRHAKSISYFIKATEEDPDFAMAYRNIAWCYANIGDLKNRKKYFLKTFELRRHISDRERYLIEGDVWGEKEQTYHKSIAAYKNLLELYPDDLEGNLNYGLAFMFMEEWDQAIKHFEICKNHHDPSLNTYTYLANCYMAKGQYQKSREIFDFYVNNFKLHPAILKAKAYSYLYEGKFESASIEAEKFLQSQSDHINDYYGLKGVIHHLTNNFEQAKQMFREQMNNTAKLNPYVNGIYSLLTLYNSKGKFKESLKVILQGINTAKRFQNKSNYYLFNCCLISYYLKTQNFTQALSLSDQVLAKIKEENNPFYNRIFLFYKALAYLKMNKIQEAEAINLTLEKKVKEGIFKNHIKYFYYIKGLIALETKEFNISIVNFNKSLNYLFAQISGRIGANEHALFLNSLALVYQQQKEYKKAEKIYLKITILTTGRRKYGDIYAKSFFNLAKIYQQRGWEGKAIENYENFLSLWKDADSTLSEPDYARSQLQLLKNSAK